ncbi:TraR/DksA family transcriptional regulator [Qipengyuania xiapuensis]|uniref:TraR/DksA family transcriptional regulator n=1 Tax=Qipengyuania xiapuensis TaxID=2867236 RepID=UPI001FFD9D65|nr:TraR/DksA family transcriptional regulator [Qipengyuania xiapuensis]
MDARHDVGHHASMTEEEARTRLIARRDALDAEDAANADLRDTVELQQDSVGRLSRMDAMQQQAMAQATARRRVAERARIEAALARIDEGEWGWCTACGNEVAEKRLAHDPSVAKCVECAG